MTATLNTALLTLLLALTGCSGEDEEQFDIDQMVVYAVLDTQGFLYDQNLIGLPVGPQDVAVDCLLGGTAQITGSTSGEGGTSLDLLYSYDACESSGSGYSVALTGDVEWSGSFRSTGYKALGSTADSLSVIGTVQGSDDVDETCALSVTDRGEDGEVSTVSGEWCGRNISF